MVLKRDLKTLILIVLNPKSIYLNPKSISLNPKSISLNPKSNYLAPLVLVRSLTTSLTMRLPKLLILRSSLAAHFSSASYRSGGTS